MVFSSEDKAIIKNDYEEKSLTAYRICKEHKSKEWVMSSVQCLLKRRTGSGQLITVRNNENSELVKELICSQEELQGT